MKTHNVIGWYVYDATTDELIIRCATRDEARRIAAESGGRVAKIVRVR